MNSFTLLLSLIYFLQGLLLCYFTNYFKVNLSQLGVDYSAISKLSSMLVVPFMLKIFYGPLIDFFEPRVKNLYKNITVLCFLILASLCIILLLFSSNLEIQKQVNGLFLIVFLVSLLDVVFDTASVLQKDAGSNASIPLLISVSRGLGLGLTAFLGWSYGVDLKILIKVLVVLSVFGTIISFKLKFATPSKKIRINILKIFQSCLNQPLSFLFMIFLFGSFAMTSESLLSLYLKDKANFSMHSIESFIGIKTMGLIISLSLLSLIKKNIRIIYSSGVIMTTLLSLLCIVIAQNPSQIESPYLFLFWGIASGCIETCFLLICLGQSRGPSPATTFLLYMTFANIGLALSERLWTSGLITWGFEGVFMGLTSLGLMFAGFLFLNTRLKI